MKTYFQTALFALLLFCSAQVFGQAKNFKLIRVDMGLSSGFQPGDFRSYGFGAFVEPKVNLTDHISAGLRTEGLVLIGGNIDSEANDVAVGLRTVAAIMAKGEYYFTTSPVRPFAGLGVGMYASGGSATKASGDGSAAVSVTASRNMGVAPSVGINLGAFRLAASYNVIFGQDLVTMDVGVGTETVKVSRNYFTFDLGFTIGGGRL